MEGLDLLKKDWQKSTNSFTQIGENELSNMLKLRSSSIVKWIFIVSICELLLGIILGITLSLSKTHDESSELLQKWGIYEFYLACSIVFYLVVVWFIYRFYQNYRKISVVSSTKELITNIINTRRVVKRYIAFNLISFAVLFIVVCSFGFYHGYTTESVMHDGNGQMPLTVMITAIIILILITAVLTLIFWLIYKLIYGILLRRLNRSYEELKKMEL
ncbi:hypothetical protein [Flavobacterium sp.]|uniref:hypothetical protein n=1 Tax=Flavobacterium sp. TaxID=239 RepID=UPI00262A7444|nr:hypothetical protein [Flavobacterium sp.]